MTDLTDMLIEDKLIEIAQKMLKRGLSTDAVAEDTGLNAATVCKLNLELHEASVSF
jgi:hypothetical protein